MGAWGSGPLDNDTALDWVADTGIEDLVAKVVRKALMEEPRTDHYEEQRAAIDMLLRFGAGPEETVPLLELAQERLMEMLADEEYLADWVDRNEIEEALRAQIAEVADELVADHSTGLMEKIEEGIAMQVPDDPSSIATLPPWSVPATDPEQDPMHFYDAEHERWVPRHQPPIPEAEMEDPDAPQG
jgi:hypothetical protein